MKYARMLFTATMLGVLLTPLVLVGSSRASHSKRSWSGIECTTGIAIDPTPGRYVWQATGETCAGDLASGPISIEICMKEWNPVANRNQSMTIADGGSDCYTRGPGFYPPNPVLQFLAMRPFGNNHGSPFTGLGIPPRCHYPGHTIYSIIYTTNPELVPSGEVGFDPPRGEPAVRCKA